MTTSTSTDNHLTNNRLPTSFTCGPVIGSYMDQPIYDFLIDNFGTKRIYAGISKEPSKIPRNSIIAKGVIYAPEE